MSIFRKLRKKDNIVLDSNILPQVHGKVSKFNLSEGLKTTMDFNYLVPIFWEEVNPGDVVNFNINSVCRLNPTVAPIMDNMRIKYYCFFVPNRLLWKHWANFMGEKIFQEEHSEYIVPTVNIRGQQPQSLADYLGCPVGVSGDVNVSALPFRAYNKIYNDWFIAFQLQEPVKEYTDDSDDIRNYKLLKKGKVQDYFTSALPTPSLETVQISLTGNAPVMTGTKGHYLNFGTKDGSNPSSNRDKTGVPFWKDNWNIQLNPADVVNLNSGFQDVQMGEAYADLSKVSAISIEDLWKAEAVQQLLMRDIRGGLRYTELIHSHWGVTSPDFRQQRAEFLGSTLQNIDTVPIAQTSSTDSTSPQGSLSGISSAGGSNFLTHSSFSEHGIFMVLACADSDVTYQQGLPRKFSKKVRLDYMFPEFANLTDQPILNKEIYCQGNSKDEEVFGYQERYREYRQGISKITGKMRSGISGSLDVWHLAQKFDELPKLNEDFIKSDTPIKRVLAVQNEPALICDFWFDISMNRRLPKRANPGENVGRL